jgi:hypothetical protein
VVYWAKLLSISELHSTNATKRNNIYGTKRPQL